MPLYPPAGGGAGSLNVSAGTTSNNLTALTFANSNGVSFGLNGSVITGTVATNYQAPGAYLTTAMLSNAVTLSNLRVSAGTTSNLLSAVTFDNGGGVSFGLNAGTITATVATNYLTSQSNQALSGSNGSFTFQTATFGNLNGLSFYTSNGSVVGSYTVPTVPGATVFSNSNNVSFGLNGSTVTATATFAQTNQSAIRALGVSNTGNTAGNTGVSTGVDWVLAGTTNITISQSTAVGGPNTIWFSGPNAGAGGGFAAQGSGVYTQNTGTIQWANSNGITFGLSTNVMTASHNGLTTAAQSDHSHGNPTLALTNISGSTASASNGFTLSLNNLDDHISGWSLGGNTLGTNSTGLATEALMHFAGGANITLSGNSNTITIIGPTPGGGAGVTGSYYENMPILFPGSSAFTISGSSIRVQPFMLPYAVSMSYVRVPVSMSHVLSTAGTPVANSTFSARRGQTDAVVIYSLGTGTNSRHLQYVCSGSAVWTLATTVGAGTASSQYTISYNITYPQSGSNNSNFVTNYGASSASIVLSSNLLTAFTGPRFLDVPMATSLNPGNYWIAFGRSTSTATQSANISFATNASIGFSTVGVSQSALSWGPMGLASSASDNQLQPGLGIWTTNAFNFSTSSMAMSQISNVASNPRVYFQFIRHQA